MKPSLLDFSAYNSFDGKLAALVGISILIGIYRGSLREIISVITWGFSAYMAYLYGEQLGSSINFVTTDLAKKATGSAIIFASLVLTFMIIKFFAFKAFSNDGPGAYDRFMGAVFGAVRGVLLILAILVAIAIAPQGTEIVSKDWYKDSVLTAYFQKSADDLAKSFPQELKNLVEKQQ